MIFNVDINEWQVSMDTIQLPIRVAVGQWSRPFLSEIFFTEVLNLNKFLTHCFYFLRILCDLNRQNFLQTTKYETKKKIHPTQGSHYYDARLGTMYRCLEHFSYLTHQQ